MRNIVMGGDIKERPVMEMLIHFESEVGADVFISFSAVLN